MSHLTLEQLDEMEREAEAWFASRCHKPIKRRGMDGESISTCELDANHDGDCSAGNCAHGARLDGECPKCPACEHGWMISACPRFKCPNCT